MSELNELYEKIWTSVLSGLKGKTPIFQDNKAIPKNWIYSGKSDGKYTMVLTQGRALVKLEFDKDIKEINDYAYYQLMEFKEKIESKFGNTLIWFIPEKNKISNISFSKYGFDVEDEKSREKMVDFLIDNVVKLELATWDALVIVREKLTRKHFS